MSEYGLNLRRITDLKDERSLLERMKVPWIFDSLSSKVYLLLTSAISVYFILSTIYMVVKGL